MSTPMSASREQELPIIKQQVRARLSAYGRNCPNGDYCLADEDLGTHEIKVLVYDWDSLSPELLESVSKSLLDYSWTWRVRFVKVDKNGKEAQPAIGIRVSALGPEPLDAQAVPRNINRKTRALYDALIELLAQRGRSDPFGHGDYWIVDDKWAPLSQKLCIFKIGFLSPSLANEIQGLLKNHFTDCVVWCQLEIEEPGISVPLAGIRIYADRIEQDWNLDKLRSDFGKAFLW
jgi:hypothetical protein